MKILTKVSSLLGLMMMGSMTASNVKFKTILQVTVQGSKQVMKIQSYLDQLFVGIVPLAVTLFAFWLLMMTSLCHNCGKLPRPSSIPATRPSCKSVTPDGKPTTGP